MNVDIDIDMPETSKNVVRLIVEKLAYQNSKGLEKYGKSVDEVGDDEYDWQAMAMEELLDGIQYVMIENGRLRKDNALLYAQNDRLHKLKTQLNSLYGEWLMNS